ncbi:hypothetical protein [Staphylococcus epidermidis]
MSRLISLDEGKDPIADIEVKSLLGKSEPLLNEKYFLQFGPME